MTIDEKQKEAILNADLGNILKKVKEGRPLTETERARIEGIEGNSKSERLGLAPNLAAAVSRTGIPKGIIQQCKNLGCTAFRANNNIDCDELLDFAETNREIKKMLEGNVDMAYEVALDKRAQRRTREHKLEILEGKHIALEDVEAVFTRFAFAWKNTLLGSKDALVLRQSAKTGADPNILGEEIGKTYSEVLDQISNADFTDEIKKLEKARKA